MAATKLFRAASVGEDDVPDKCSPD